MILRTACILLALEFYPPVLFSLLAQEKASTDSAAPVVTADYPRSRAGVLIDPPDWPAISAAAPAKIHAKRGFAPAFTYGAVPATTVAEYQGPHASVEVEPGKPIICICHTLSLPGNPAIVRLHLKKDTRELDGGKLRIGAKVATAEASDLIAIAVSQPENGVWLVQPRQELQAGEYALMLGTQNMSIFPFTVAAGASAPAAGKQR